MWFMLLLHTVTSNTEVVRYGQPLPAGFRVSTSSTSIGGAWMEYREVGAPVPGTPDDCMRMASKAGRPGFTFTPEPDCTVVEPEDAWSTESGMCRMLEKSEELHYIFSRGEVWAFVIHYVDDGLPMCPVGVFTFVGYKAVISGPRLTYAVVKADEPKDFCVGKGTMVSACFSFPLQLIQRRQFSLNNNTMLPSPDTLFCTGRQYSCGATTALYQKKENDNYYLSTEKKDKYYELICYVWPPSMC